MNTLAKLKWQCRRGTKELDWLLTQYLELHYQHANDADKKYFEALLDLEDSILMKDYMALANRLANNQQ